jgi:hypothetical protein
MLVGNKSRVLSRKLEVKMNEKVKSVYEAIDILDDFIDDLDENFGLVTLTYGRDASKAMEFLHSWLLKQDIKTMV